MKNRPTFQQILDELNAMQERKGRDYGSEDDPLANLLDATRFGIQPWISTMLRANDKMCRIQSFVKKGTLANESLEDSLVDLAVYTIHALRLYREQFEDNQVNLANL